MLDRATIDRIKLQHRPDDFGDCGKCHPDYTPEGNRYPCDAALLAKHIEAITPRVNRGRTPA